MPNSGYAAQDREGPPQTGVHEHAATAVSRMQNLNNRIGNLLGRVRGNQPSQMPNDSKLAESPNLLQVAARLHGELDLMDKQLSELDLVIG